MDKPLHIQRITQLVSLVLIHWMVIYPVDSSINLLNKQGLKDNRLTCTETLEDLGWTALEQRRADARLGLLFKIYNGLIPVDARKYFRHPTRRSQHSHSYSFIPLSTSTSSHCLSLYPRTITRWNNLPQSFFENTNLTKFKQSIFSFNHHVSSPINPRPLRVGITGK